MIVKKKARWIIIGIFVVLFVFCRLPLWAWLLLGIIGACIEVFINTRNK